MELKPPEVADLYAKRLIESFPNLRTWKAYTNQVDPDVYWLPVEYPESDLERFRFYDFTAELSFELLNEHDVLVTPVAVNSPVET